MAAQTIMAAGAAGLLRGLQTSQTTLKGNEKALKSSLPFEQVMGRNQSNSSGAARIPAKQNSKPEPFTKGEEAVANPETEFSEKPVKTDKPEEQMTDKAEDSGQSEELQGAELLEEFAGELKQTICDLLKITEDELDAMLEKLGLTMADLMEPANIQMLVMENAQTSDPSIFLTDETASGAYKDILEAVEKFRQQLSEENGLKDLKPEEFAATLEKMTKKPEEQPVEQKQKDIVVTVEKPQESGTPVKNEGQNFQSQDRESSGQQEKPSAGEQFLQNLSDAFVKETPPEQQVEKTEQIREIARQIVEQIKVVIRPGQTSMEMQLNPDHLGKVNLSITSKNGMMTAQFLTQNQIAKEAIESQVQTLRETLEQQGIKVEAIEVSVAEYAFQKNGESDGRDANQQEKSKKRHFNALEDLPGANEEAEEETVPDLIGSSVNYTA